MQVDFFKKTKKFRADTCQSKRTGKKIGSSALFAIDEGKNRKNQ